MRVVLAEALAVAESDVRLFDRPDETDGRRRLGVALATAPDLIVAGTGPGGCRRRCANSGSRDPEDRRSAADRPTMAPFLGALAIIVLVVIAIGLFNLFGKSDQPEDQQVGRAAVGQNDALQRQNYADFRTYTCATSSGVEADMLARQRDSVAKRGERFVDDVTDVVIDGDRATANSDLSFRQGAGRLKPAVADDVRTRGRSMEGLFDRPQLAVGHSRT